MIDQAWCCCRQPGLVTVSEGSISVGAVVGAVFVATFA
jgi:hypothetical protein